MSAAARWNRWRRWAFVLGVFALGIPATAAGLVRSNTSRARLHSLASTAIRDELGLDATIGRVQLQLVPFSLVARDITLDDPVYGRTAEADELRITPSFRTLLRGGLDIHSISISGADLRLVVRNGEVRNLPRAEGGGDAGLDLPFDALDVYDSTLTVDADPHGSGQLRGVDLHLRDTADGFSVEAQSEGGWVRHSGGREAIRQIDGLIEVTEAGVRIPRLRARTDDLTLSVDRGGIPLPLDDHGYSGHVQLSYDLSHLARAPLPEGVELPPIVGQVEVDVNLSTEDEEQRARGSVDLAGARIEQFGVGDTVHLEVEASRREVRLLEGTIAHLPSDGGTVRIDGTVTLDPDRGFPVDVTAHPQDLSMTRLMVMLGVTDDGIAEWFFDGSMELRGTLDPLTMAGPIDLQTRDFQVSKDPWHARRVRRVISVPRADFTGRWAIDERAVRFENLVGHAPNTTVRGNVHLGFDNRFRVDARTDDLDLRDITPLDQWPIHGTGRATCTIDNTFQDPVVTGHVAMSDFVFDDFRLGQVESDWRLDPDGMGVHFAMVDATKRESRYRVEDLYLDFHQDRFELTGLLHLDDMQLADFYHVFGYEEDERFTSYQGRTRGQASLRYTNGFPDDTPSGTLLIDANLDFPEVELDGYAFTDGHLVGRWRWLDWSRGMRGAELSVAHLSMRKGRGTVTLDGELRLGGALDMTVVADRLALAELEGIGERLPGLAGVGTATGRVGGTVDVMRATFDVGVTNVTYDGQPLGDGRFYVRMADTEDPYVAQARDWNPDALPDDPCAHARMGLAHADWPADPPLSTVEGPMPRLERPMAYLICGRGLDDHLLVDLAVGRSERLPLRGVLRVDGLDLSPMLPELPDGGHLQGGVTGELAFRDGGFRSLETLEGSVHLSDLHVGQGELEVRNRGAVRLGFKDGVLAVERARFAGPESQLRVLGYASLEDGLALDVGGDLDLGLVARLSRAVREASGRVRARVQISGELADPQLFGQAEVRDGSFTFASFEPVVTSLEGRVRFSERSVLFEDFGADVAGGHLTLSGEAELRDQAISRYAFDVDAAGLSYDFAEGIEAELGADTELVWSQGERLPTVRGELRVTRFEYTRPIELRSLGDVAASIVRSRFRTERTTVRSYDPDDDLVALDLRVNQASPFLIDNNLISARVQIRNEDQPFRIVGTDQRFGVLGAMEIRRGQVFFQGNQFDVRSGTIDFTDETRIEPRLDVIAQTEIRRTSDLSAPSFRITLSLRGTPPDDLTLSTRSEPELSQEDVLTLLAIGMTRAELNQLQQGEGLATSAALDALTRITGVDREVRRTIGIDEFGVVNGYSPRTGRSEPRLSIGSRIAERVRLSATTGIGESREFRGAVELQVDENQRVGVSYDNYNYDGTSSFGNLGVDWVYHLEFE